MSDRDPELSASPSVSPQKVANTDTDSNTASHSRSMAKPWKHQFIDRIHIEKNWRQGKAQSMTLIGHKGSVTDLKFDEYRLITCSDDGSIVLWHLDSMKKWKPKSKNSKYSPYHERLRKQLERGDEVDPAPERRYTFFPTQEERKDDGENQEEQDSDLEDENDRKYDDLEVEHDQDRDQEPVQGLDRGLASGLSGLALNGLKPDNLGGRPSGNGMY